MASRYITICIVKNDNENANSYFSSVFFANILLSIIFIVPILFFIIYLDSFINVPIELVLSVKLLFFFTLSSMIINIITAVFGVSTFATNRIDLRSLREVILSVSRLTLMLILFTVFDPNIFYVGIVALVLALINFLIQYIYTKKLLPKIVIKLSYFNYKRVIEVFNSGLWNSVNLLGNALLSVTSLYIINLLMTPADSGTYAIADTIPIFMSSLIAMLAGVFFPVLANHYSLNEKNNFNETLKRSQQIVGYITSVIISVYIIMSVDFFKLWTPSEDSNSLSMLSTVLIISHVVIGSMWTLTNVIILHDKVKYAALATIFIGFLATTANILGIIFLEFGLIEIAITTTIAQLIRVGLFIPIYTIKILKTSWLNIYIPIIKSVSLISLAIIFIRNFNLFNITNQYTDLIVNGIVFGIIFAIINGVIFFTEDITKFLRRIQ